MIRSSHILCISVALLFSAATYLLLAPVNVHAQIPDPPRLNNPENDGTNIQGQAAPLSIIELRTPSGATCTAETPGGGQDNPETPFNEGSTLQTFGCSLSGAELVDGETIFGKTIDIATGAESTEIIIGTIRTGANQVQNRGFLRDGIFGCSAGEFALPTGTLSAIGGIYVPVNDAAVTLNTGYLVYKECVLDGVIVKIREAAAAAIVKNVLDNINNGRNGDSQFPRNLTDYRLEGGDEVLFEYVKEHNVQNICEPFKNEVRVALARQYMLQTRNNTEQLRCAVGLPPDELQKVYRGDISKIGLGGFADLLLNQDHPYAAFQEAEADLQRRQAERAEHNLLNLRFGNGLIPREEILELPTDTNDVRLKRQVLTPGFLIARTLEQVAGSGFRQLENADEIDQVITALFSGMGNQIITDIRGLRGLSESRGGQPPYLNRLSSEASAGVRQAATNAALSVLNSTLAVETEFLVLKENMLARLNKAEVDLRAAEALCWERMIPAVQSIAFRCTQTRTTVNPNNGGVTAQCIRQEPIPLNIDLQVISSGELSLPVSSAAQPLNTGSHLVSAVAAPSPMNNAEFSLSAPPGTVLAPGATARFTINPGRITNGTASVTLGLNNPFTFGQFTLEGSLPRIYMADPEVAFSTSPTAVFDAGEVTLFLVAVNPFAQNIIDGQITTLQGLITQDVADATSSVAEVRRLAQEVSNTASQSAQRIALEQLDTLVAQRVLHTAFDVKTAQEQSANIDASMNTLIEDTITSWGTGSINPASGAGWCNSNDDTTRRYWLNQWRAD